jgi:PAT family beta-lactamase induction signal transducer AmpG
VSTQRKLLWITLLYFAEGFPFGIVVDNLPVYFRTHGVSLSAIGLMSLIRTPWWAKVFWSPAVDQVGERRLWIAGSLVVMAAALVILPYVPPAPVGAPLIALLLVFTTAAATQDIAIDAYTIELLEPGEEGVANGVRVSAYRVALIVGGGALIGMVAWVSWGVTYAIAAAILAMLTVAVLRLPRVGKRAETPVEWARTFRAWIQRPGASGVFLFVFLYKLGDTAMGPMVKPFWVDRGLRPEEIALISTTLGVAMSIAGALVGGLLTSRWGIFTALWTLGLLQAGSNLGYAAAAWMDAGRAGIYAASIVESFSAGLGTAAFLSFLMNICDKEQAATQFALLSALFNLSGSLAGSISGRGVELLGYAPYFALTFLLALPAYGLLPWIRPWIHERSPPPSRARRGASKAGADGRK